MSEFNDDFDFGCNLSDVEEDSGFELLTPGEYVMCATSVELKDTKAGTGKYIKNEFTVTEGPAAGRKVFANFNIVNPNPEAVKIGLSEIKAWCMACGLTGSERMTLGLVKGLINQEFVAVVKTEKGKGGYDDQSRVKKFKQLKSGAVASQTSAPAVAPAKAAPATTSKMPWEA